MSQVPTFHQRLFQLYSEYEYLIQSANTRIAIGNGVYERYKRPVLTPQHVPLHWKYDLNPQTNPFFLIRLGVNAVYNAGAIEMDGRIRLIARIEGYDRKSFFAVAESVNGVEGFKFWNYPVELPETDEPDINVYDMRLTRHADGWIYGVFSTDRPHPAKPGDPNALITRCGIARTHDLLHWERLPDLQTPSGSQRECMLHPEFVDGDYAFYLLPVGEPAETPQGIRWGLCRDIKNPVISDEQVIEDSFFHPIHELPGGLGPCPIRTEKGWLHLAHGARQVSGGICFVLYAFLTSLEDPTRIIHRPGGYLIAPEGQERIGDKSNALFSNGWVARTDGTIFLYYSSSDTRLHVATTSVERLLDYVIHTPQDGRQSASCVRQRLELIRNNQPFLGLEHF